MLSRKWTELFAAFEQTRREITAIERREDRKATRTALLFLLGLSALGFLGLLIRHVW